jgi:hypothetical protein
MEFPMRASPLRVFLSLGIALAVATPLSAAAATLEDRASGFRIEVAPPGVQVCVIVPRQAPDDAGCEGIDTASIADPLRANYPNVSGFALLRLPGGNAVINLYSASERPPQTQEQITSFMTGVQNGSAKHYVDVPVQVHGRKPGTLYDIGQVNGIDNFRFQVDIDVPQDDRRYPVSRTLTYTFAGPHAITTLSFTTDPAHAAEVESMAEGIVKTASMSDAGIKDFGRPRMDYVKLGELVGNATFSLALIVGFVLVVMSFARTPASNRPRHPQGGSPWAR